jgi:hypothetical protein
MENVIEPGDFLEVIGSKIQEGEGLWIEVRYKYSHYLNH